MGGTFSTPSPNPSDLQTDNAPMTSSESSSSPKLQSAVQASDPPTEDSQKIEGQEPIESGDGEPKPKEEEEEEEGECMFCVYMKGGGCRDSFIAWEDCIKEAEDKEEDIVEKCYNVTSALKTCMDAHSDYYAPLLQAEKAAEAEVVKELEEEEEAREAGSSPPSSESDNSEKISEEEKSKSSETN